MSKNADLAKRGAHALVSNYKQPAVAFERGKGCELWDADGKRYVDLYAGIAVNALGHAHPRLVAAIAEQAGKILHTTNLVWNEPSILLAEKLAAISAMTPGGAPTFTRSFFCNSGAEANEACIKLARRHAFLKGETQRTRIVAFKNAFHGRTMGVLPITGTPKYWEGFGVDAERVSHVAYGSLEEVRATLEGKPREYCAIVVEPVQGEGGVLPAPRGFLAGLRALADEFGALLIIDEVQTGIGRTGKWFGYQHEGVRADAISLAKGLGGGVPIGAMMIREELNGVLTPGTHGTTFGGNPLATSAALAVIETIEQEKLLENVIQRGEKLSALLNDVAKKYPKHFEGERGVGLLRGLILRPGLEARVMQGATRERGAMTSVASERVLRFTPPLTITDALLEEGVGKLDEAAALVQPPTIKTTLQSA
jgi:acetylornithine/N-succinyldiaminopimelate aminotransferase